MLHIHEYYSRIIITGHFIKRINILRIKCPACNKIHAVLLSFLISYYQYSLNFIFECLYLYIIIKDSYSKIVNLFHSLNLDLSFNVSSISSFKRRIILKISFFNSFFANFDSFYYDFDEIIPYFRNR